MLDISLGLLVLTAIIFFVLVFLLNSWLYRPLLSFMQERDESIRRDLENAAQNESGSKELFEEAHKIVSDAKHEASAMKQQAIESAKAKASEQIEAKKAELEAKMAQFMEELAKEEESIKSALISQMPLFKEALKAKFTKL